jgi:hypothetical protein
LTYFFNFWGSFFGQFPTVLTNCHKLNAWFCLGWSLTNPTSDDWFKKMHWFKRYYVFIPFIFYFFT